ncbi:hypothetical protein K435DRAFT_971964 [Dendrothele bispora CBS 962.96]|uniref:Crinkler family protein n=1 Tax=Dendrothele bispora (strain CBS 962.96) TaxID=1314807 RepID=A0A4S8L2C9_DENBC|nr:hypothetical protein K435DRAFT_971964 [Dendrothele bispora CBS 962.96]
MSSIDFSWESFRADFWGKHEKLAAAEKSRLLFLPPNLATHTGLRFGRARPNSFVYIREEYRTLYSTLEKADEEGDNGEELNGFVVTGNPGIGKSLFNFYALARRLSEEKSTLYSRSGMNTLLFTKDGVFQLEAGYTRMDLASTPWVWCFHDPRDEVEDLFASCFLIATVSPSPEHYRKFTKEYTITKWYMNPWIDEAERKHWVCNENWFQKVGPILRDYTKFFNKREELMEETRRAISVHDPRSLSKVFETMASNNPFSDRAVYHRLIVVSRDLSQPLNFRVTFRSLWIENLVREVLLKTEIAIAEEIFKAHRGTGVFAGLVFERLTEDYLIGKKPERVGRFFRLEEESKGTRKFSRLAVPSVDERPHDQGKIKWYDGVENINVDSERFWIPHDKTNALFDAITFDINGSSTVIWVYQVTVSNNHIGSDKSYVSLEQIYQNVLQVTKQPPIVRYVLVLPRSNPSASISWKFPADEDGCRWIQGDVYVQFISLSHY